MIAGIGVDTVDIDRFSAALERTAGLGSRLFVESELAQPLHSLAARFAAKEALIKALGGSEGLGWHDAIVEKTGGGAPVFAHTDGLVRLLGDRGLAHPHLSLTHDAGVATAFVVIERSTS